MKQVTNIRAVRESAGEMEHFDPEQRIARGLRGRLRSAGATMICGATVLLVLAGCGATWTVRTEVVAPLPADARLSLPSCRGGIQVGATPMRTLSRMEYNNTIHDLLGDATAPANRFPPDQGSAAVSQVTTVHMQRYVSAAERLAAQTVAARLAQVVPCDLKSAACAATFVRHFGLRAFRRPLVRAEVAEFLETFNQAGGFNAGVEAVIRTALVSPNFLYHIDRGRPIPGTTVAHLTGYDVASRLSYLLWRSMPDQALLAAAEAGQLESASDVERQVRRMLSDRTQQTRLRDAVADLYERWFGLGALHDLDKNGVVYPGYSSSMRKAMASETRAFLDQVTWEGDGKLETLLTAPFTFADGALAKTIYGISGTKGKGTRKIDLDPTQRAGILTQPAILAVYSLSDQTSPVMRGSFIRETVLCHKLPDPPASVMAVAPEPRKGVPTRERWSDHTLEVGCASCHKLMDPIGFGFEHYDGIGRWRDKDEGFPIDDAGEVMLTRDLDGEFKGAPELARKLAGSTQVRQCVSRQWFRLAFDRVETPEDACSLAMLDHAFSATGQNMRELLVALTRTDAFMYRSVDR